MSKLIPDVRAGPQAPETRDAQAAEAQAPSESKGARSPGSPRGSGQAAGRQERANRGQRILAGPPETAGHSGEAAEAPLSVRPHTQLCCDAG